MVGSKEQIHETVVVVKGRERRKGSWWARFGIDWQWLCERLLISDRWSLTFTMAHGSFSSGARYPPPGWARTLPPNQDLRQ